MRASINRSGMISQKRPRMLEQRITEFESYGSEAMNALKKLISLEIKWQTCEYALALGEDLITSYTSRQQFVY